MDLSYFRKKESTHPFNILKEYYRNFERVLLKIFLLPQYNFRGSWPTPIYL